MPFVRISLFLTLPFYLYGEGYDRVVSDEFAEPGGYGIYLRNERNYILATDTNWVNPNPSALYLSVKNAIYNQEDLSLYLAPSLIVNKAETDIFFGLSRSDFNEILQSNKNQSLIVSPLVKNGKGYRFYVSGFNFGGSDSWFSHYKAIMIFIDFIPEVNWESLSNHYEISFAVMMDYTFQPKHWEYFHESDGIVSKNRIDVYNLK